MAEPFKNELGEKRIKVIATHLAEHDANFDESAFLNQALSNLDDLSLMERNRQIVEAMNTFLPSDFVQAKAIIVNALAPIEQQVDHKGIHSWLAVPMAEFLGRHGTGHLSEAMDGLAKATPLFSSEWGIRHLIDHDQNAALKQLHEWTEHTDEHVRRLVSEGSRPRLPWGFQLKAFIEDPELTFPLLEKLKDDPSDYVRLSVSNHLNDISKDHPDYLQQKLTEWLKPEDQKRTRLIKHACRTLIKQGHQPTLEMLGFKPFDVEGVKLIIDNPELTYGESLKFMTVFTSSDKNPNADVIVDYAIHFKKANGSNSAKVFKWKVGKLNKQGGFNAKKSHAIKPITTRKYYNGDHQLEVFVNGKSIAIMPFTLAGVD